MFADPFQVNRDVASGAAVLDPYNRITLQGNSALYLRGTVHANFPKYLRISHAVAGSGRGQRDRRLAQFQLPQVIDSVETGLNATFSIIADIPRVGITSTQTDSAYRCLVGLLRMASSDTTYGTNQTLFWDKFLRGES